MEYYAAERKGALTFRDSMDGTGEYYAKWNKPIGERQIPYDLTRGMEIKNRLTAARGEGEGS